MSDEIEKIVEKILNSKFTIDEGEADTYGERGGIRKKIDARTKPRNEPDKPLRYEDWIKSQPKPKTIGIHKTKKK